MIWWKQGPGLDVCLTLTFNKSDSRLESLLPCGFCFFFKFLMPRSFQWSIKTTVQTSDNVSRVEKIPRQTCERKLRQFGWQAEMESLLLEAFCMFIKYSTKINKQKTKLLVKRATFKFQSSQLSPVWGGLGGVKRQPNTSEPNGTK